MNRLRQRLFVRALEDRTVPATFTVQNLNDSGADSLRDCISKANAAAGADTVNFNVGVNGTITLTSGEIGIAQATSIFGPGSNLLTISGNNASRIFNITSAPAAAAISISKLTMTAANAGFLMVGGGIYGGDESLTLTDCALTASTAFRGGALHMSNGTLTATRCAFIGNSAISTIGGGGSGGIDMIGGGSKAVIKSCTVSGNSASMHGGIYASGYLNMSETTVSGNISTSDFGGGIVARGVFAAGALTIRNCTISGNSAATDGGGVWFEGSATLVVQNSTITNNSATGMGGGIRRAAYTANISLESTIVSGNINATAPDISSAGTVSVKTSAIGSGTGFTKTDLGGNLPFQAHANLKLGPLQNNGGLTFTHMPANDSPLISVGSNPAALANDQRGTGFARVIGLPDIGAVETKVLKVTNTNDSGTGSLRQAISDANLQFGLATVTFDPAAFASAKTIGLSTGEIAITRGVTINGPAAKVTINGNAGRIFNTSGEVFEELIELSGLTLTNGKAAGGGAILMNDEVVTLKSCAITNSTSTTNGGAIRASGATGILLIEDSTLTGNIASFGGGAIGLDHSTTVTIRRSTVAANTAGSSGGAIEFDNIGNLTVEDSTFSGNTSNSTNANGGGGAIYLFNATSKFLISNSTLSGNQAPTANGGAVCLVSTSGPMTFQNCTITGNSAGTNGGGVARINLGGVFTLNSTIIAGNTNVNAADMFFSTAGSGNVPGDNNLIGVADVGNFTLTGTNNQTGTKAVPLDAKLGPLASNGGPTQTHSLLSGSPAINAGNNAALLTNDQRGSGFSRVNNAVADIGAFESKTQVFVVTNDNNSGAGSLRQAILDANANGGMDTIAFDPAFFNIQRSITLSSGVMIISDAVHINGPGASLLNVSGNLVSQIFSTGAAPTGTVISISGMSLLLGKAASQAGGAIDSGDEQITLSQCDFTQNHSQSEGGGAVSIVQGSLTAIDCSFLGNKALKGGGAVRLEGGNAVFLRCALFGNESPIGGALFLKNVPSAVIEDCTLSANSATTNQGGAIVMIQISGGPVTLTVRNSTITGNSAADYGGAIALDGAIPNTLTVQNSTIVFNTAGNQAGGISTYFPMTMESSILFGNQSPINPEAISNSSTTVSTSLIGSTSGMVNFTADTFTNTNIGVNPMLGPLAKNGGPTETRALLTGSKAINNGSNPAALTNDQRGFSRVAGTAIDIGAFESQPLTLTVDVLLDENDFNYSKGDLSLREAVLIANNNPGIDTITFDAIAFGTGQPINLTLGEIALSESAALVGIGTAKVVIDAKFASRVFSMKNAPSNSTFTIENLTVKGGSATTGGGIYASFNNLTLNNCVISGNKATQLGAGVDIVGKLTATNCLFTLNSGGASAIRVYGTTILTRCTVSGNTAFNGGGMSVYGPLTIDSCTISGNTATGTTGGGGIEQSSLLFSLFRNSTISGNTAAGGMGGGVLFTHAGAFPDFQNCTIANNSAASGGGIASKLGSGIIDLISSIVSGNTATVAGPDLYTPGTVNALTSLIGSIANVTTFTSDAFTATHLGKSPLLAPLANNGGPTMTHALLSGSPAINNGSNPAMLANDQRGVGFLRSSGATDIGAFEVQLVPSKITAVQINDGSAQRSRITSLTITFDQAPMLPTNAADGFQLQRQSDNAIVTLLAVPSGNTVTLTFTGGVPFESTSLADGRYTLTALASKIVNLDGDGNGTIGDDYKLASEPNTMLPPTNIFRLFGDVAGDGAVSGADFNIFRTAFGGSNANFDFDNDGSVSASDFSQFRIRFGGSI